MNHDAVDVQVQPHRVTVTCSCGHEAIHPTEEGAMKRHGIHQHICAARAALEGDTTS